MKTALATIAIFLLIPLYSFSQYGNEDGHLDDLIKEATNTIKLLQAKKKKEVTQKFSETGFQEKSSFKKNISGKNLKWIQATTSEYGFPPKEEIEISEWKVKSTSEGNLSQSVNITFYFKRDQDEFSHTNDRISLNYKKENGTYQLNGILLFKKEEYENIKNVIEKMP